MRGLSSYRTGSPGGINVPPSSLGFKRVFVVPWAILRQRIEGYLILVFVSAVTMSIGRHLWLRATVRIEPLSAGFICLCGI